MAVREHRHALAEHQLFGHGERTGGGDLASFLYPVYSFAARTYQSGTVPLWNPHLYAGSPFAADMQSGVFYPINVAAFLLARPFTYTSTLAVPRSTPMRLPNMTLVAANQ